MGIQIKIIAASDATVRLSSDTTLGFRGLAGLTNEDKCTDVAALFLPIPPVSEDPPPAAPTVNDVYRNGSLLVHDYAMQYQVQDMDTGNTPCDYLLAALPFGPEPGETIEKRAYVATPQNSISTFVNADFIVPALGVTVQVTVLDATAFTIGDYVDRATNEGLFVGSRFWDIVSIDSSTTMTIRLRDVFGAVVIMLG